MDIKLKNLDDQIKKDIDRSKKQSSEILELKGNLKDESMKVADLQIKLS